MVRVRQATAIQLPPARFIRPARLQQPIAHSIRCLTCERRCEIGTDGQGWCRTRCQHDGHLVTLTYGAIASLSANPIEKKPLYHFYPGTVALTSGSLSCNFACSWCQNASLSKRTPGSGPIRFLSPADFVQRAVDLGCQGTSISLNEPTLSLEWSLDVFRLARERGLYNTFVTNGYMTPEALDLLIHAGLDAMNVDIKGDGPAVRGYCGADVEKVWRNCRLAREAGVWLEITTMVIPGVNDEGDTLCGIPGRIVGELGAEVPWHVNAYYPAHHFTAPPTPLATLERAWQIGRTTGLDYVYIGNTPGHRLQNTYCPACGDLLVARRGLRLTDCRLTRGHCPGCARPVLGVWSRHDRLAAER
jgi:pyruvate formate lyase activating enzyme